MTITGTKLTAHAAAAALAVLLPAPAMGKVKRRQSRYFSRAKGQAARPPSRTLTSVQPLAATTVAAS